MLSRNILKITSTTKFSLPMNIINFQRCNRAACCASTISRSPMSAVLPISSDNNTDYQSRFYSTKKFSEKISQNTEESSVTHESSLVKEEELLEKFITILSSDIYAKNRVYKNDLQRVISKVKEYNFSKKKQGLLLLRCCTELLPDEPALSRMSLAEEVWNTLKPHTTFEVEHYNELLRVYIANKRTVKAAVFINEMSPVKPNMTTYELLLQVLAEAGDVHQATEVISNMKSMNFPATENMFNSLITCQGKAGNLQQINEVLTMMTSLKIERSADTYTAVARAMAFNKKLDNLLLGLTQAVQSGIKFKESHIMDIIKTAAEYGLHEGIPKILRFLPEETLQTPSISPYMQSVCTQLVFNNHPLTALEIYKALPLPSFGPKDDQGLHGRSLVRDCVKANIPSGVIVLITQDLMASGRNPIALQNAAEASLQLGKTPLTLELFQRMKQLGLPLRCHYFWPILVQSSKSYGEKGIMNTLQTMAAMEVTPDYDTMMQYVLPFVSFTSPQNLMKKFLEANLTASIVLTPTMETLMSTGQVRAASEICELFYGKIDAEKLLKPLIKGYLTSMDLKSTIHILEDMSRRAVDKNKDWIGRFLCKFIKHKQVKGDCSDFLCIVRELKNRNMMISTSAADFCLNNIPDTCPEAKLEELRECLIKITDEKMADDGDIFTTSMPHPKHMNEESLKAHLAELEAKGMNTRGVLRKLLQEYCKTSNLPAAKQIVDKCQKEGVHLSAGMKAAIFDLHVKMGELEEAELVLTDLNKTAPNFLLDEYKVIDFATLMVYMKRIDKAFDLINEQSKRRKVIGGQGIAMNCWRLLDAVAANNSHVETRNMFDLLHSLGYCKPTNVMLGPLIRPHLKFENLEEAVNEFVRIGNKYNKTPLKHELLCAILKKMSDGMSEEKFLSNDRCKGKLSRLAQSMLNINKKIHGPGDVQMTVIAALADVGYKKTLRKMFLDPEVKFHPDALMRQCEWFAEEKKVHALRTVAECAKDLRHIDVTEIYDLILDVYQREDKTDKALELWHRMQEQDVIPSQKFVRVLVSMAKSNKKKIPSELVALSNKQQKAANST